MTKPNRSEAHPASARAIIFTELRQRRWSIMWWVIGIAAFITLNLAVYPTFREQAAEIDKSLQQLPDSARSLFSDTADFMSPIGYLSSQVFFLMLPLLLSILAIGLGSSLIAREEQQHTIELLLSRPLSRTKLLFSKAAAGGVVLLVVSSLIALLATAEVTIIGFEGVAAGNVLLATLMALIMAVLFGAIAFALTAAGKFGRGASIGIATLFALGGYIITSLDQTVKWLQWPAKVLPFHYYHPAKILDGSFTGAEAAGLLVVIAVLLALAWFLFRRRDIE